MIWPLFKVVEKMIFLFGGVCLTDLQTNLFCGSHFRGVVWCLPRNDTAQRYKAARETMFGLAGNGQPCSSAKKTELGEIVQVFHHIHQKFAPLQQTRTKSIFLAKKDCWSLSLNVVDRWWLREKDAYTSEGALLCMKVKWNRQSDSLYISRKDPFGPLI